MRLTAKQEKFCRAYLETGNALASYRKAYSAKNMGDPSVRVEASRLLSDPNISLYLKELLRPAVEASQLTIAKTLEHVALAAYSDPTDEITWGDKLNALDKAMKHLGMFEKDNNQRAPNIQMLIVSSGMPE